MYRNKILQFSVASLVGLLAANLAVAQGGYGGRSIDSITRQDIGTGYTSESLNQIALRNAQARGVGVPNPLARSAPRSIGLGVGPTSKPFDSYTPGPTTSPYLNLFREDFEGNADLNYNTLVRPMLQQQQFNQQMQRQSMEISRRLQSIAAQADFNPQGSQTQYPTGHTTVFNYTGHFYPALARQRR